MDVKLGRETPGKNGATLPKTEALTGSLQVEYKRCGKPGCRCASGAPHGPYVSRRWREGGRQRRRYVRPADLDDVREALARQRRLHPPVWWLRQALAGLRRLEQEVRR